MTAEPAYLRAVSLHLSRVLDEIGLNKATVKRRRHTYLFSEQLTNAVFRLTGRETCCYHFGSQTEGATTSGLGSDLDTLLCSPDFIVIEDWSDWQQDQDSLLMLQDKTVPGYCRLQLLRDDLPLALDVLPDDAVFSFDDGRVIMKNTALNTPLPGIQQERNGPATSEHGGIGFMDRDFVSAFPCKSWPRQAHEFIKRKRRHGWPSHSLLQQAIKQGVFLVPVGYKLSPTENLEWRISASLTERCLMFSLYIAHIKCYLVLKILIKTFIEPRARKVISSYHCKTALFHSMETTEPGIWRDDNLLQCVKHCLTMLLTWVTDRFCPHFVIAGENLFAGKVTAQNRILLKSILTDLINGNGRALLQVHIDNIGHNLQGKLSTEPSVELVLDSPKTMWLLGDFEFKRHNDINVNMKKIVVKDKYTKPAYVIRSVKRNIVMCKYRIRHSKKYERQATELLIENLSRWLGSMLASFLLSDEMRVSRMAIQLLCIGANNDIASTVKLASVFFNNRDFRKVEAILCGVEIHVSSNPLQSVCGCYTRPTYVTQEFVHYLHSLRADSARNTLFAHCVRFSPQEFHCVPPALQSEFFRSVGDDLQRRDPIEDKWMAMAAVDCLPALFFLQYMTYRQLGQVDLQKQSLHNMDRCLREDHSFGHLETGWNLLGQCLELEQEIEAAMACYKSSLDIRPRNNAANWHVAILVYKVLRS